MNRWFIVGDIHGRYDLLAGLLKKWEREFPDHRLAFLGDYIDRGPDAFKVISTVKELTEKKGAVAVLGNHECFMLDYYNGKIVNRNDIWFYGGNGGQKTLKSYEREMRLYGHSRFFESFGKSGHADWVRKLPLYYEDEELWLSHAPIPAEKYTDNDERKLDYRINRPACVWTYHGEYGATEESIARDHGKLAVCGHVHALREGILVPRVYGKKIIYADTGCGCWEGAPLSAVIVEGGKYKGFVQEAPPVASWLKE